MPFPSLVFKDSGLLYFNNENITAIDLKITYTGDTPLFSLTNQFGDASPIWDNITLGNSGIEQTHNFIATGQKFAYHIVFVSGRTTITQIEFSGGVGMTAEGVTTDLLLDMIVDRSAFGSPTITQLSQLQIGEGQTSPTVSDTALETPVPIDGEELIDDAEATTGWTANGTNSLSVNTSIKQRGAGALNLIKSDTGQAETTATKTVTSLDFTSKEFFIFVNVSASLLLDLASSPSTLSGAVEIRYGSDSGNYFRKSLAVASITSGRNVIRFTSSNADATVGAPVLGSMDFLFVGYELTGAGLTSSASDFVFDDSFLAETVDFFQALQAGFPSTDLVSDSWTVQSRIDTTEANGFLVGESGFFNADGTVKLGSHNVFTPESKGDTDEFIFTDNFEVTRGV